MTGPRFRIDSTDFRGRLSQETITSRFSMIFGFLAKSLIDKCLQNVPKLILGGPWMLPGCSWMLSK